MTYPALVNSLSHSVGTAVALVLSVAAFAGCGAAEPTASQAPSHMSEIDKDALAGKLIRFAGAPGADTIAEVPFANEVSLGLGDRLLAGRSAEELIDGSAWVIHAGPAGFRERSGPFSALDLLARADQTAVSVGSHGSCNNRGQDVSPPAALADLRRVSIQPDPGAIVACMQWWSVDLYITRLGEIRGVTLNLGEP